MARPRKENADYFSHDTNMRSHRKIIALRTKFKLEWYAVYCMLLEHIASCDFFTAKRDVVEQEIIAGDFWVSVEILSDIVSFCGRLDLLQNEDWTLKCKSLIERLQDLISKRDRERNRVSVAETTQPVAEKTQSKVKESKGNKIKEKINEIIEEKQKYLDFVFLTKTEHTRLLEVFWEGNTKKYIDRLNWYIWQIGEKQAKKKYVSHYFTIRNRANKDWTKKIEVKKTSVPQNEVVKEMTQEEKDKAKQQMQNFRQTFISKHSVDETIEK